MPDPDPITRQIAAWLAADDTPDDVRSKAARAMVRRRWARTPLADRAAATQAGRDAQWAKYLAGVPATVTDPAEREALAREARRAHMTALAAARIAARRARRQARLDALNPGSAA
jgi:hypothetical protein